MVEERNAEIYVKPLSPWARFSAAFSFVVFFLAFLGLTSLGHPVPSLLPLSKADLCAIYAENDFDEFSGSNITVRNCLSDQKIEAVVRRRHKMDIGFFLRDTVYRIAYASLPAGVVFWVLMGLKLALGRPRFIGRQD